MLLILVNSIQCFDNLAASTRNFHEIFIERIALNYSADRIFKILNLNRFKNST